MRSKGKKNKIHPLNEALCKILKDIRTKKGFSTYQVLQATGINVSIVEDPTKNNSLTQILTLLDFYDARWIFGMRIPGSVYSLSKHQNKAK